ncbi:MAG: DMT family transporter [Halioglobus sp.]
MPDVIYPPQALRRAVVLSFVMIVLASTAAAATKFASATVSTEAIVTVQYFICLLMCLPRIARHSLASQRTHRLSLHLLRGVAGVAGFYLFYVALEHIPMVDAMLLRQSAPLLVPVVLWTWSRERVARSAWWPLSIGFIGIVIILRPSTAGLSGWHAAGFLSALTLAISMVATGKLATTEPTYRIVFYYAVLSLVCVAPFSIGDFSGLTLTDWAALLYIGFAISLVLNLYTQAYGLAPAATIAPINYFAVPLAGIWGWMFWGQVPDGWSLAGGLLVITGGILTLVFAQQSRSESRDS